MFGFSRLRLRVSRLALSFLSFYARVSRDIEHCLVGLMHYSRDLQVLCSGKKTLKMGLTHLKNYFSFQQSKRYPKSPLD